MANKAATWVDAIGEEQGCDTKHLRKVIRREGSNALHTEEQSRAAQSRCLWNLLAWELSGPELMKWQNEWRKDDRRKRYCWNRMDITWEWFSKDKGKGQRQRKKWWSSLVFKPDDWEDGGAFSEISGPQSTASHCPPHEAWDRFCWGHWWPL